MDQKNNNSNLKDKKILLTGGGGFLGKAVYKKLIEHGVRPEDIYMPKKNEYDLREKKACSEVVKNIDIIIHLAASVGGIQFNKTHPAEAFYDSAAMSLNLIDAAHRAQVKKFVGVGSVCEYPKFTPVPFSEESLWDGYPEESNGAYGLAKKFMLAQTQAYREQYGFPGIHLLMVNLYGPGDNFDLESSHVIPALIRKIYESKNANKNYIDVWGTGKAGREFLYVDDAAEGILLAAEKYDKADPVNIGCGREISIKELVETICELMEYRGEIRWDPTKPDGQLKRILDISRANKEFGFTAKTKFKDGLKNTINWYKSNVK